MAEETVEEKLERLLELEKVRDTEAQNLKLLISGIIVIVLSYVFCF